MFAETENTTAISSPALVHSNQELTNGFSTKRVLIIVTGGRIVHSLQSKSGTKQDLKALLNSDNDFQHSSLPAYDVLQWKNIIDSASVEHEQIITLALQIKYYYYEYDGFVIIHGVKTLTYTSSYLSFMLENLGKPVVLTDAYARLADAFTDAKSNLLSAILIAGRSNLREVCVCFNRQVFRGNRVTRYDSTSADAFLSPNFPPLGTFSTNLVLRSSCITTHPKKGFNVATKLFTNIIVIYLIPTLNEKFLESLLKSSIEKQRKRFEASKLKQNDAPVTSTIDNIAVNNNTIDGENLRNHNNNNNVHNNQNGHCSYESKNNESNDITENHNSNGITENHNSNGITENHNSNGIIDNNNNNNHNHENNDHKLNNENNCKDDNDSDNVTGVILAFYGVGNAPERKSFKDLLMRAIKEYNCEIVVISQTMKGPVNISLYASGNYFSDVNLISSMDMTLEATVAKLSYLMGKSTRGKELRTWMETPIRGELTSVDEQKKRTVNYKKRLAVHSNFMQKYALQQIPANNRMILPDDVDKK